MSTPNPMPPIPPQPPINHITLPITGLLVDIYGLDLLPASATSVTCLWLHHARTRSRADMADIASRCITAYNSASHSSASSAPTRRGLIALAFDQRNHGSRLVEDRVNGAWREGNETHAQDMFGVIAGCVADQAALLDAVGGYLFTGKEDRELGRKLDGHLALGVSLGGHSVWQTLFAEPRIRAGVVVIGCCDYEYLLRDRARLSRLSTYSAADSGASFTHSKDFPPALVEACKKLDPKAILFGTEAVPAPGSSTAAEQTRLRAVLDEKVRGKKILLTSGGADKAVPYRCSEPFLDWFKDTAGTWYADGGIVVEDKIYPGAGHAFTPEMVVDAVKFVVDVVKNWDGEGDTGSHVTSKI